MTRSGTNDSRPLVAARNVWITRALCLWALLAVAVGVKTLISPDRHTVFPKCAARAVGWWSGEPLYVRYEGLGRFPYSPTFAIMLSPFAMLGHCFGAVLWTWLNIGVYVWGLRRLVRDVLPGSWPPLKEAAFLALAMLGAIRGVWNAQSNALIIGLLMVGLAEVARQRWWRAAFLMAGATYLKLWPAVIPLLVLTLWPRRFAGRFLVAMAAGALLPFLTQPFSVVCDQYRDWFALLGTLSTVLTHSYRDIWTLSLLFDRPVPATAYRIAQAAAGLIVLSHCHWQSKRLSSTRWTLMVVLGAGSAWMMLLGPAVEYNTYVVLAPAVTWALLSAFEARRARALAAIAFLATMILGAGAIERPLTGITPAARLVLPVGTLLFVIWLARFVHRKANVRPSP